MYIYKNEACVYAAKYFLNLVNPNQILVVNTLFLFDLSPNGNPLGAK